MKSEEINKVFDLSRQIISNKICFVRKLGKNVFQAYEYKQNLNEKIIYSFKLLEGDHLHIFDTMELEI